MILLLNCSSLAISQKEKGSSSYSAQCDYADNDAGRDASFVGPTRGRSLCRGNDRLLRRGLTGGSDYDRAGLGYYRWW